MKQKIYLITGLMASGKSTVSDLLAKSIEKCVHLRGDVFRKMIISGRENMSATPSAEAVRQLYLRYKLTADAAKSYFDNDPDIKVYYTRLSDTYPSLTERSDLANEVGADRFYSVHINSAGSSATGTETLYNSKGYKSSTGLTSYNWSATIHPYIRSATGFTNRGLVNRTGLAVLRHTKTSSTLTEIGFISNKSEAKKMNSNLTNYGKAVYNSTKASFSKNPTGR